MKLSFMLMFMAVFQISASTLSQEKVNLEVKQKSMRYVFKELRNQTGLYFVFSEEELGDFNVSINVKDVSLDEALIQLFEDTRLDYELIDDYVVIKKKELIQDNVLQNEETRIKGKIVDENGEPVPGANIIVKEYSIGTVSGIDGDFDMLVDDLPVTIEVSFIGFVTQDVQVSSMESLTIVMKENVKGLSEVVVTGIITRKEESYTGSALTLKSDDLQRVSNSNIFQSLKNLDPSLNIASNMEFGSDPNKLPNIQLRGTSTFPTTTNSDLRSNHQGDPNQPLFILDGFRVSAVTVFDLDMDRVQSITILKDASAKALYGSRAANGVIVIETKRPLSGKLVATYNGSVDITMPDLTSYDLCNALEKLEVEKASGVYESSNMNTLLQLEEQYNERYKKSLEGDDTYWLSKPLQTGVGTKHAVAIEMGEQKSKFIANISYKNVKGVMKESDRTNIAGSMSVDYRWKKLLFRNSMSVNSNTNTDSPYGSFGEYARMNPYQDAYNADGSVAIGGDYVNPLYNATINTSLTGSYFEFINNFYTEWSISADLKAIARVGVTKKVSDAHRFFPGNHTRFNDYADEDIFRKGSYQLNKGDYSNVSGDLNLQYSKTLGKHFITSNIGFNIGEEVYSEIVNYAEGFPSDRMNDMTFALQYASEKKPFGEESTVRDMGFLGIFAYSYDNRFLSDITIRRNASSQFGTNKRWGTFWSAGLGWNIHNESFFETMDWFKVFKIRGSIGTTGSQNFKSYQAMSTYNYYTDRSYNAQYGAYINALANEDLQWQQKLDYNIGADIKLGIVNIKFDHYKAYTENLITTLSTAPSLGYPSIQENIGRILNKGYELSVNLQVLQGRNGFLNLNFHAITNDNEIVELSDAMRQYNDNQDELAAGNEYGKPVLRYVEGGSMNSIWAVPSLGIDPATGQEIYVKQDGSITYAWDPKDQIVAGNSSEKYRGNFGLNGEYKGFGFSFVARFITGGEMYNSTLVRKVENIDLKYNVDRRVLTGRWSEQGQHTAYKTLRPWYDEAGNYVRGLSVPITKPTTRFVQERSEIDFSSASIYYELPQKWIKGIGLQRLKVAANMNDIYKFSTIKVERGTEYPFARTLSLSVRATF